MSYYLQYLTQFPDMFLAVEAPNGDLMGYIMGKVEGRGRDWHGHVTAVTVGPHYRGVGVAGMLMGALEKICIQ